MLRPRQARFIDEYLVDLNATQAAIRAGYSSKTARQTGEENLSKPDIRTEIDKRMKEREKRTRISQDAVVQEIAKIAFSNIASYATWGSKGIEWKDSSEIDQDATAALAELSEKKSRYGTAKRLKLLDKVKALELLGRHLGMFKPLPPLEAILAAMPPDLAGALRQEIAKQLAEGQ